jgi:hypothetical protein
VVIKSEIKVVKIPESILTPCSVTAPPTKAEYLALTPQKKEQALTDYILDLHRDIRLCNIQVKKIKEFQDNELNTFKQLESK